MSAGDGSLYRKEGSPAKREARSKKKEVADNLLSLLFKVDYFFALMADCAAESLAMGTLNGEQLT
jgi:hypothetical protein